MLGSISVEQQFVHDVATVQYYWRGAAPPRDCLPFDRDGFRRGRAGHGPAMDCVCGARRNQLRSAAWRRARPPDHDSRLGSGSPTGWWSIPPRRCRSRVSAGALTAAQYRVASHTAVLLRIPTVLQPGGSEPSSSRARLAGGECMMDGEGPSACWSGCPPLPWRWMEVARNMFICLSSLHLQRSIPAAKCFRQCPCPISLRVRWR